jgi:hypothetical protein
MIFHNDLLYNLIDTSKEADFEEKKKDKKKDKKKEKKKRKER